MASEVFRCIQICYLIGTEQLAFLQMQITSCQRQQTNYTSAVRRGKERGTICEVGHEVMMRICSQFPSSFANNYLALDIHVWVAFIRLTEKCHNAQSPQSILSFQLFLKSKRHQQTSLFQVKRKAEIPRASYQHASAHVKIVS